MIEMLRGLGLAARRLRRAPAFTAVAVLTLAVGIGANTALFSVVKAVLLEPLPYDEPAELVTVAHEAPGLASSLPQLPLSEGLYFVYRNENRTFADLGIYQTGSATITGTGTPERVPSLMVTDGTLSLLGADPVIGRLFSRDDDRPGSPPTVILSHAFWERRFGRSPGALDQNLIIDGIPTRIIGVLSRDVRVLETDAGVYLPARFDEAGARMTALSYLAVGRLRPGVAVDEAEADLRRLFPIAFERYPSGMAFERLRAAGFDPLVRPMKDEIVGGVRPMLWVLLGTVGLVLLLACANVANLLLVRAESRHVEVAVLAALGAGPRRVAGTFLAESLLIAGLAAALGLALASSGLGLLLAVGPDSLPRLREISLDAGVVLFTAAIALASGIALGLLPAVRYRRPDLHRSLKQGSRGGGRHRFVARNVLVVAQVALALILLVGAGLMVRSVASMRNVDPGFGRAEEVLTFQLFIPESEIREPERLVATQRQILEGIAATPGVVRAGASWSLPMSGAVMGAPIQVDGVPDDPGTPPVPRRHVVVSPGYPETLLQRVAAGRTLDWADIDAGSRVVLVTENLAREQWGTPAEALGRRIRIDTNGDWYEVVGVLGDLRDDGVTREAPPMVFWPLGARMFPGPGARTAIRSLSVAVRASGAPHALQPAIERAVWAVNPNLPLASVRTLDRLLADSMARATFAMIMLAIAAGIAVVLGVVGIYGVISYVVSQRSREIGVRMALGAHPAAVRRMVVRQAAGVTALGIAIGAALALGLTRVMRGLLYGVSLVDPVTYGAVALVIIAVALAASWLPARRAAGIHPSEALRSG